MAFQQTRVAGPVALATSADSTTAPGSASYTVPATTTTIIKQIMLSNITASARTVTLWVLPNAASIGNGHILFHDLTQSANETTILNLSLVMATGDAIYARADAGSSVNMTVNGIEES